METDTGTGQDAGSSSQASGVDLSGVTRGAWKGSDVTQHEIDWLYRSRRIPEGVSCRLPGDEIEPDLKSGEFVVFLERGFGLLASDFFRRFLDFYQLQPHHLPGNAIFYLSCYATFMEAYMGLRPTRETFARFFSLRINSIQGKEIPKPKPVVQCGSCIIGSRQGSPFFKFSGLESCRAWQETFFYVKNTGAADLINLPAFNPGVPTKANWSYNPKDSHIETNRIVRFMKQLMKDTAICSDDIVRTFISRRVLPLKRRAHKMSEMYGPGDPTKITGLPLSKEDVVLKARQICQSAMPLDWEWGLLPLSSLNPPTDEAKQRFPRIAAEQRGPCRNRALDKVDPDPYIHWTDLKMGRTHTPRPGNFSTNKSGSDDEVIILEVHEHVVPLQAEVGQEFLEKLSSQDKKKKAPAPEAGSSEAPPAKRQRQEVVAGRVVSKKNFRRRGMPTASGPALKISKSASGIPSESSEEAARPSPQPSPAPSGAGNSSASPLGGTTSAGRATPTPPDHRAEEDKASPPETEDTNVSNIDANTEAAGGMEPLAPTTPKKKKKKIADASASKTVPDISVPAGSTPAQGAPDASMPLKPTPPLSKRPIAAEPTPFSRRGPAKPTPPPEGTQPEPSTPEAMASGAPASGPQPLVLHASRAALLAGEKASGQLGRITELKRGGNELGHLLDYAEKWNRADVSTATRGLGKDRLPAIDPAGPRCTEEHFMRLRRAVKELDNAWHDATNNVLSTADARKHLFEELLWEHRDLCEAHNKCQAEKEQLIRDDQKALDAQKVISGELKEQAIQAGLRHDQEMKDAKAAAEAKLAEVLEDSTNSSAVLRAELEEAIKGRKAAEDQVARLTAEQKEYDQLVMQTDALALRLFPESQVHAQKKVMDRRVAQKFKNLAAPWDPYDHLVALSARVQHMRAVDRHLADLPDLALQLYKVLWPKEVVPDNLTLISERLKGAGRRIREWQCSAARAGADAALRVAYSWYEDLDLDALHSLREDAPTDKDPVLTAKRKDRAYWIAEYAPVRTFIPAPPNVHDFLSDEEEEEEEEDEDEEAGDAPPEAGDVPPEAPEAGAAPPEAPVA
ncbi:hypothetical protein QYE76_067553 [Lolium multiflorum]|uniref:Transposase (putative) gypsy type domain-containing protein n=1 Tax=Lolium multiflorum TaxID=4521 RepID=A0AAD8SDQ0_LOLMU|nr:hypothetical protein QYE76_067553 [Lolium multiflorum]